MICTQEDEFVFEKMRWVALLSDGRKVYQDDNRPGETEPSAWVRLRSHLEDCKYYRWHADKINITQLYLQFRSHIETPLPTNADGYYFCHGAGAVWGGNSWNYYKVGYLQENKLSLFSYKVPEIITFEPVEYREIDLEKEKDNLCLIQNWK